MATAEQKAASRRIMDAVTELNSVLIYARGEDLFVQLQHHTGIGGYTVRCTVATIETRETVLP
jgi:hypothetical protein